MYKYISLLLVLLSTACTQQNNSDKLLVDLTKLTNDTLYYSSFVDSLSYVTLETDDDCLIGEITDAILTEKHIFILDAKQQTIWIFSPSGKLLQSIHHPGNGPGEYVSLMQFEYDSQNEVLLLLDGWSKTILHYSLNGNFIDKKTLDIYPSDFKKIDNGYLLSLLGAPDSIAGVYHYNLQSNEYTRLVARHHNLSCGFNWELVTYDDTISFMAPPFDNEVYHYDKGQAKVYIPFRMTPSPTQEYEYTASKQDLPDFIRTNYIEGRHWVYATYWCAQYKLRVFLYNKRKKTYEVGKVLFNDMDGVRFTSITSDCNHNRFVFGCISGSMDANLCLQILHLKTD